MSTIRQRAVPSSSPPVDSAQQLSAALKQVKESASTKGVTDFSKCLGSAAEKNKIKLRQKKPTKELKKTTGRSRMSKICLCLKVLWVSHLFLFAILLFMGWYEPAFAAFSKVIHVKLYHIVRPIRFAVIAAVPIFKALGMNLIGTDCLIENPILGESEACPCIYVKETTEITINESFTTIPKSILNLPTHEVYIVRNALDTSNVTLDAFQDFKLNHPSHRGPKACQKLISDGEEGLQKMSELYKRDMMAKHMNATEPWAFTWIECPNEERPQSFRSLLPHPAYLAPFTSLSKNTMFTLSTQWGNTGHNEVSFPEGSLMAVLVVVGDVRFMIDNANPNCYELCTSFRGQAILQAGDVLIFDQYHWNYMSVTWSKYAITSTVGINKL